MRFRAVPHRRGEECLILPVSAVNGKLGFALHPHLPNLRLDIGLHNLCNLHGPSAKAATPHVLLVAETLAASTLRRGELRASDEVSHGL